MRKEQSCRMPDYYPHFACKGGACRATCCRGWDVSLPMDEYFRLLGLDCSPELRARLDGAFHAVDAPSPERYAQISHNWLGDCPMQREDGLCALQCECGETVLPAVCRRYPRGARGLFDRECACSNSCEAVLEMFWDREAPLGFVEGSDGGLFPEAAPAPEPRRAQRYRAIRALCFGTMQDRSLGLAQRLLRIGRMLRALNELGRRPLDAEEASFSEALRRCREIFASDGEAPRDRPGGGGSSPSAPCGGKSSAPADEPGASEAAVRQSGAVHSVLADEADASGAAVRQSGAAHSALADEPGASGTAVRQDGAAHSAPADEPGISGAAVRQSGAAHSAPADEAAASGAAVRQDGAAHSVLADEPGISGAAVRQDGAAHSAPADEPTVSGAAVRQSGAESSNPADGDARLALRFLRRVNCELGLESGSVGEYAARVERAVEAGGEDCLRPGVARLRAAYPNWEVFLEHMLVNHMFYECFPFSERRETMTDEYASLGTVAGYVTLLCAFGRCGDRAEDLIDVAAAGFRLIGHSAFDWNADVLWRAAAGEVPLADACDVLVRGALG